MAWTQADIDTLKAAMAKGVRSVTFGDQSLTFHSLDEQRTLLALMQREVNTAAGKPTTRYAVTSKGIC